MPYIMQCHDICKDTVILEIGCGEGGNLLPFAKLGCNVLGVDISKNRINEAKQFFAQENVYGTFICDNIFSITGYDNKFDIIICHDVIEHIADKYALLEKAYSFLKDNGILFIAFPAWQMPFGGHQQICRNGFCSKMPFIHLLPLSVYNKILFIFGENDSCIKELLNIKAAGLSIEHFESIIKESNGRIVDRILWFINPHYKQKFKLKPRKLIPILSSIRYIRNYFSTSCFYITK